MADGAQSISKNTSPLIDGFGRRITYLRLSVTDRCDLRCAYCMPERAQFRPKSEILSLEELEAVAAAFIARGVDKIRLTGGEPLVRRNIMHLVERLGRRLTSDGDDLNRAPRLSLGRGQRAQRAGEGSVLELKARTPHPKFARANFDLSRGRGEVPSASHESELAQPAFAGGLKELTLTTNGTQLAEFAAPLRAAGVRRINVSLDTLDRATFAAIARRDVLAQTLAGIDAALAAGLAVKINTVALKGRNVAEIPSLIEWAHARGMELTLIEIMPMGEIEEDRIDQYAPLSEVRKNLERRWTLTPDDHRTGGPARYVRVKETGGRLGLIAPLTANFCDGCNRMRVTCTGELFMCLGQQAKVDLRAALRAGGAPALSAALDEAMAMKPKGHDFAIARGSAPSAPRTMSVTGG